MSFDNWLGSKTWKGIKEKRKPYRAGKAIDTRCRNNGWCPWCRGNRTFEKPVYQNIEGL